MNRTLQKNTISPKMIYFFIFLFTLHLTPIIYITSSYLAQYMTDSQVGFSFTVASVVALVSFLFARKLLSVFGNFKVYIWSILCEIIALLTLAFAPSGFIAVLAFVISFVMTGITFLTFDIFLESISKDASTGAVRGVFLTSLNFAFFLGPFVDSLLIKDSVYLPVFVFGVVLLILLLAISFVSFGSFKDPKYVNKSLGGVLLRIWKNTPIRLSFFMGFMLRFFFAWMVIFSPIFLNQIIGFTWSEIGLIIGIALIPFLLFESWLGKLADTKLGEKEIMALGFLIAGFSTITIYFLPLIPNFWMWAGIFFMTRVGASMIEVTTESYLFKHISARNVNIINLYRGVRPLAYLVGSLSAALLLFIVPLPSLFLILGFILLGWLYFVWHLEDTR